MAELVSLNDAQDHVLDHALGHAALLIGSCMELI